MAQPEIESVVPGAGVEGGEVIITCRGFAFSTYDQARVHFGGAETRPISCSPTRVIAPIPASDLVAGEISITLSANGKHSKGRPFVAGEKIAENLHPVSNPAYDRDNGAIYTTLSGTRGQKVPVSVYKITPDGESEPSLTDIVNPPRLPFRTARVTFITSRFDGTVYRVTPFKEAEAFAHNLG